MEMKCSKALTRGAGRKKRWSMFDKANREDCPIRPFLASLKWNVEKNRDCDRGRQESCSLRPHHSQVEGLGGQVQFGPRRLNDIGMKREELSREYKRQADREHCDGVDEKAGPGDFCLRIQCVPLGRRCHSAWR